MQPIRDIFQILIRRDGDLPSGIPDEIRENIRSVTTIYPDARHHLMSGKAVRDVLSANFSGDVLEAYDALEPYAYKADLARYCLLFIHGGLYADLSARLVKQIDVPETKKFVAFRDRNNWRTPWMIGNSLILTEPGRPELKLAIDLIVANCKSRHYGEHALVPTGPALLGRAIAMTDRSPDYWIGEASFLSLYSSNGTLCWLTPEGDFVAFRNKTKDADLTHLGLDQTNSYNEIWSRKQVYGEKLPVWGYDWPEIRVPGATVTRAGAFINEPAHQRCIIYGPYAALEAGRYEAVVTFAKDMTGTPALIDVCAGESHEVLKAVDWKRGSLEGKIKFSVNRKTTSVEVRVYAGPGFSGTYLETRVFRHD